jgi:hypothetical protein
MSVLSTACVLFALVPAASSAHPRMDPPATVSTRHVSLAPPPLFSRDMAVLDRVLRLESSQRDIVSALLDDCIASGSDASALARFGDSIAVVLEEGQRLLLPAAWAEIQRDRIEAGASVGGEGVDVAAAAEELVRADSIARALSPESRARLEAEILRYRTELQPILFARLDRTQDARGVARQALALRNANDAACEAIAAALPDALAGELRARVRERGFPAACAPSLPLAALRRAVEQLKLDERSAALARVESEASRRFAEIRDRAVAAMRARDDARVAGDEARDRAEGRIRAVEDEYEALDLWIVGESRAAAGDELLRTVEGGRGILEYASTTLAERQIRWDDQQATLERFDANKDGQLDDEESARALTAFARSASGGKRRKL